MIAELGSLELTTLTGLGLFIYLWRQRLRWASAALLTVPLASLLEAFYKHSGGHAGPPYLHPDGPSVTDLLDRSPALGSSYPSGHMVRAVLAYGLLVFVIQRLTPAGRLRRLALPVAAFGLGVLAFDRLYLAVHWESDVIGGTLLGGTMLAAAISWMDATADRDAAKS